MSTKTITGTAKAWLTEYRSPEDLQRPPTLVVSSILSYSNSDMKSFGWTHVGEATITVTVPDERTLVENKVESLREEKKRTLAEAQAKATDIESKIQKLLAISYTPGAV